MERKQSILQLTDEQIGKAFRALYVEHEDFVMATFGVSCDFPLTPKEVVKRLREMKMDQYASQFYILAAGMMMPVIGTRGNFFKDIDAWRAAYWLADELDVPVDAISPTEALKYLEGKRERA